MLTRDRIICDGEHFVAVDKPAGWLCVPSRQGAADTRPCLGTALTGVLGARVWPVHRLDVEVSGLVLFARNPDAHRAANLWFEQHLVAKVYQALTEGDASALAIGQEWTWRSHLLRGKRRAYESPAGKIANTVAIYTGPRDSWLRFELRPQTGRPHQLRFHLSTHGFPIAGDMLYAATRPYPGPGIGLRAVRLDFSAVAEANRYALPSILEVPGL